MKYLHFDHEHESSQDLLSASLSYFEQSSLTSESRECISKYADCMQQKSKYVALLEKEAGMDGEPTREEITSAKEVRDVKEERIKPSR